MVVHLDGVPVHNIWLVHACSEEQNEKRAEAAKHTAAPIDHPLLSKVASCASAL
jgi:hypothetical protein